MYYQRYAFPVGDLYLFEKDGCLSGLYFHFPDALRSHNDYKPKETELIRTARSQLEDYFAGKRKAFDLPLAPKGTPFQLDVWEALKTIPYGETVSYGDIAARIGRPKAFRAVGLANNRNPISIIVPCHRVVGASGKLVGYGGGIENKKLLLDLEKQYKNAQ
ncbi:MAG: methylated-DNA--[protein]-cysteine S-methyltransferase [Oscillospiraceae bacterium]|jgi:methylated-DNA-[protein]-cysteine S-methyltransferase|nr:methylated-DNA--[protein]-cysteine S-methyltransferase [Oscillospiraceae bacterium]